MTDDFELEADITLDVSGAVRDARRLAGALADLNDATGGVDSNIERLEKSSAQAASTLARFTKEGRASTTSVQSQAKAVNALVLQYQQLSRTQGKSVANAVVSGQNPAQVALKSVQKQMDDERAFSALQAAENKKQEAEETRHQNELTKISTQLAAQRATETRKSEEIIAQGRAQAAAKGFQAEEAARKRELASLRDWMQNREKYLTQAYAENNKRSVAAAVPGANALNFGEALKANSFEGLREGAAYADMMNESLRGLANQRYALYDVATTVGVLATATAAAGTAAVLTSGQYDKAFGQVERTTLLTGDAAAGLREELVGLTTALPTSFADVAGIATLGAQMNIADDQLEGFTETVVKFSAATDTTVDAAATGFGRLAQLTKTPQGEIENLASAIYQTGINAVATESEILSVSEQIAVAGNLAGFSNTEIVALSSSLASLGVAPEQARGAFERIFGNFIPSAVAEGGEALQGFADMAGLSAEEFSKQWQEKPQEAFTAFLEGLGKVENQTLALRELGIVNVRDINVLNRLSANMDVYQQALTDTNQAYADNTALSEGAAIAQDNLIDRLTRLKNAFMAMLDAAGQSDLLNGLVELLIKATDAATKFINTPIGGAIATTLVAFSALVAVVGLVWAAYARGKASLLALVVSMRSNIQSSNGLTLSLRALTAELVRMSAGGKAVTGVMNSMTGAEARAAVGARVMGAALKGALISTGVGAALVALPAIVDAVGNAFASSAQKAEKYFAATGGGEGLSDALREDTTAWEENGRSLATVDTQVTATSDHLNGLGQVVQEATGAQVEMNEATTGTTTSLRDQTIAVGDATAAWLANNLANDENVQKLYQNQKALDAVGFSMGEFIKATLANPGTGGQDYISGMVSKLQAAGDGFSRSGLTAREMTSAIADLQNVSEAYDGKLSSEIAAMNIQRDVMAAAGVEIENTAGAMDEAAVSTEDLGSAMTDLVDSTFAGVSSIADVEGALYDLGSSLYENGNSFSAYSEAGRSNLEALQSTVSTMAAAAGEDSGALASNILGMMSSLQGMGVDTGNELAYLGDMLNSLVGNEWGIDFNSAPARQDIAKFINESIKALETRAELERQTIAVQQAARESFNAGVSQFGDMASQFGINLQPIDTVVDTSALDGINSAIAGLKQMQSTIDTSNSSIAGGKNSMSDGFQQAAKSADKAGNSGKSAGEKTGKAAKDAAKEIRTLKDYANDLSEVFDRQLEFSFGVQNSKDAKNNVLAGMKESIADAKTAIQDAKDNIKDLAVKLRDARQAVKEFDASLKSLRAQKQTLEYQLKVAVEYGDTLRANELRGEIAETNAEIAGTENDRKDAVKDVNSVIKEQTAANKALSAAQKAASLSLKGNTQAARDNRAAVQDLIGAYADELTQMAANGASQGELKKKAGEMREEFKKQLTQMGYNKTEVNNLSESFTGFTEVIKKVPRNVTVTTKASTSAASRAINEFIQKQKNKSVTLKTKVSTPKGVSGGTYRPSKVSAAGKSATGGTYKPSSISTNGKLTSKSVNTTTLYAGNTQVTQTKGKGNRTGGLPFSTGGQAPKYLASGGVNGMHPGGPKGTDTTPAWLTPGEWVIKKKAVDHYGSDFFASLNSMRFPSYLAQGTGSSGGQVVAASSTAGPQLVELMPNQVQQIVRAVSTQINVDGKALASSVNSTNRNNSTRGGN